MGNEISIGHGLDYGNLVGLGSQRKGKDENGGDQEAKQRVQFWLAGVSACEAPDDGENYGYDDYQGAYPYPQHSGR